MGENGFVVDNIGNLGCTRISITCFSILLGFFLLVLIFVFLGSFSVNIVCTYPGGLGRACFSSSGGRGQMHTLRL